MPYGKNAPTRRESRRVILVFGQIYPVKDCSTADFRLQDKGLGRVGRLHQKTISTLKNFFEPQRHEVHKENDNHLCVLCAFVVNFELL
jgi:hypothetical protein